MSGLALGQSLHNLFLRYITSTEMVFVSTFSQYPVLKVPAAVARALGPPHRAARRYNARHRGPAGRGSAPPRDAHIRLGMKKGGARAGSPSTARAGRIPRERRPPVSGALLSHGLTPQYHRRSAA